jgi:type IV secretion system protein VirD4
MAEPGPPVAGTDVALIAAGAAAATIGLATWTGARLAVAFTGGHAGGGVGEWLAVTIRLAAGDEPADAWGAVATGVPSGWAYWIPAGLAYAAAVGAAGFVGWLWRRSTRRHGVRRRFGQDTDARQARPGDVVPLRVDSVIPPTGRMLLGRMAPRGPLLATEDRERHPLTGRSATRQGNRGSVALIGPTGSGKTALAASAIATWDGPVVAVSVKRDLYDITAKARARRGEIAVFDPGAVTGLPTARWSPLHRIDSTSAALRAGRALAQAIPRSGVTSADYWAKHGETLLGALMCIAGLAQHFGVAAPSGQRKVDMQQVARWVATMAGSDEPVIHEVLRRGLDDNGPLECQLMAQQAATTFLGLLVEDHKIRSSIYATARLAVDPWLEPAVAHSATDDKAKHYNDNDEWPDRPPILDLQWLMNGNDNAANTLYLTAAQPEFERLSPVLGGLLADLKDSIHERDIAGQRLDKPLLILIDEAGQLELGWLPTEVSTIAALGAFFVTCWQSVSQIQHRYGSLADTVLSGHRTKCFFAGIDDLATLRYLTGVLGEEHVATRGWSADVPTLWSDGRGRRSISESIQRDHLVSANALRQMVPGEALLLHGTLPPIHLEAIRWWLEPRLAEVMGGSQEGS